MVERARRLKGRSFPGIDVADARWTIALR